MYTNMLAAFCRHKEGTLKRAWQQPMLWAAAHATKKLYT